MTTLLQLSPFAIAKTISCLQDGGVAAFPTETVYGLVTLWDNEEGRSRIYRMKHRPPEKRLQMLAANLQDAQNAGLIATPLLERLAKNYWPGPLTVVANAAGGDTIGLRIPDFPPLLELLNRLGRPLAATSANLSGEPAAMTATAAVVHLAELPDLLIDGGAIQNSQGASTVASIVSGEIQILRKGAVIPIV